MVELWRLAELRQVQGVGDGSALLLHDAGVRSVRDLSRRNPDRLHERLEEVNEERARLLVAPGRYEVLHWIRRAQRLVEIAEEE